ncbi:MAG TPA: hypothetical protein VJR92_09275 [Gemmatimonadaceae bacterium]|nr:hypothetical protein [Gemmatimonadaceae bacterium]
MIQWSWRVEKPRSIDFGSWSTNPRIDVGILLLAGPTIESVHFDGELPELTLALSDRRRIKTFMTEQSQPAWTMFLADDSWITVERGRLMHDTQNQLKAKRRWPSA